jgi:hypothetical protein
MEQKERDRRDQMGDSGKKRAQHSDEKRQPPHDRPEERRYAPGKDQGVSQPRKDDDRGDRPSSAR